nr:glycoside hydrolase family 32 protein [Paenibacillus beijingensis]
MFHSQKTRTETETESAQDGYRAAYHFTVPDKWMNDPQRPIYLDGKYHYYYLYNKDYPDGNGTEWRHATSSDLIHWTDEGVAIPKYTTPNGDPWSGSAVVDHENTAGFGYGAVIAIVTQPSTDGGKQKQYMWYSTDQGKTFQFYNSNPIMENWGTDFRDPKIIWDHEAKKWVMTLAEGQKVGFYESNDLKSWRYMSGFMTHDIGLIECPDLYVLRADDGSYKWILGVSANGKAKGKPNTYAYWTGHFDGQQFKADDGEPQWLDYGFDWYAGVTFEEGPSDDKFGRRYAIAWMNNWDYAHNTPALSDGFNGTNSIVRSIELKRKGNGYSLVSQPTENLDKLIKHTDTINKLEVTDDTTLDIKGDTYQLEADVSWDQIKNVGIRLRESKDKTRHIDLGIFVAGHVSYLNRTFTANPDHSKRFQESKAPFDKDKKYAHLKVLVDKTTVEVFIDDGQAAFSSEVFPNLDDKGITLFAEGGTATFENIQVKHFNSIY